MKLSIERTKGGTSTFGTFYINETEFCYTLEDEDRGLYDYMNLDLISKYKVDRKTAIPYGEYEVAINYSNKFNRLMPIVLNVKGFSGIRIHGGNTVDNTEGCPLLGGKVVYNTGTQLYSIVAGTSRPVFDKFMVILTEALKKEKVWLIVTGSLKKQAA